MDATTSATAKDNDTAAQPTPCARIPAEDAELVRQVLARVGDKWSLLVIATLQDGCMRYSDLQRSIPGISQRMLTLTLSQLHRDGLVSRTAYAEVPPRVEYALTPLGATLLNTVNALVDWAVDYRDDIRRHRTDFEAAATA
ncbi:winged helix-turn-helix transcriptional regulator [Streptomyces ipomoeae]|uniref:winged helix-turn-helix transcriptional regulator n=1 Tax=Streptomyces ipomoeae TaxID=103232 RepID=UPI001FD28A6E|nr:helix-turn-helix domain-containing protein [Streptomyces ipomoeae]MDX2937764.1 helix-turn-helix domain-containing protein [Streptomyces ipomoeae]